MKEILQKLSLQSEKQTKAVEEQTKMNSEIASKLRKTGFSEKEMLAQLKKIAAGDYRKPLTEQNKAILDEQRDRKVHNTIAGNIGGAVKRGVGGVVGGVANFLTPRGFLDKTGIVKKGSGGIIDQAFEARKARNDRVKARIMAGEPGTEKVDGFFNKIKQGFKLKGEAALEQAQRREQAKLEDAVSKDEQFMIDNGIDPTTARKKALEKDGRGDRLNELAEGMKTTSRGSQEKAKAAGEEEKEKEKADSNVVTEEEREQLKLQEGQVDKLTEIADNTKTMADAFSGKASSKSSGDSGGGMFGGIGKGLTGLGKGIGGLTKGVLSGLSKGILALVPALAALAAPPVLLGLGALTLAFMGIGKAIGYMAPFMEKLAPVLSDVVKTMGSVFIEFIKQIPEMIVRIGGVITDLITTISGAVTNFIDKITESIERLAALDGGNMMQVGLGLAAIGTGLTVFAAGSAVNGLKELVGGLLNKLTGGKSTVEQLQELAALGPDLEKAGVGMEKLARGLGGFGNIDSEQVNEQVVVAKAKVTNITSGKMSPVTSYTKNGRTYKLTDQERMALSNADLSGQEIVTGPNGEQRLVLKDGDKLTAANGAIKDAERQAMREMMGGNTNINAPTTTVNNSTSNNVVKAPVRNVDTSVNAYYRGNWIMESNASSF